MAYGFDHALTMLRKRTESWIKQLDEKTTKRDNELEAMIKALQAENAAQASQLAAHTSQIAALEAKAHTH